MLYKKYRKGVFCVIYAVESNKKPIYLILKRKIHWKGWEFCKGGLMKNEKIEYAVKREVREETGLKILNLKKYNMRGKFIYNNKTQNERKVKGMSFVLFSCEVKKARVKISKEHSSYKWVNYSRALKLLTWKNQKKYLRLVDNYFKI